MSKEIIYYIRVKDKRMTNMLNFLPIFSVSAILDSMHLMVTLKSTPA